MSLKFTQEDFLDSILISQVIQHNKLSIQDEVEFSTKLISHFNKFNKISRSEEFAPCG